MSAIDATPFPGRAEWCRCTIGRDGEQCEPCALISALSAHERIRSRVIVALDPAIIAAARASTCVSGDAMIELGEHVLSQLGSIR